MQKIIKQGIRDTEKNYKKTAKQRLNRMASNSDYNGRIRPNLLRVIIFVHEWSLSST